MIISELCHEGKASVDQVISWHCRRMIAGIPLAYSWAELCVFVRVDGIDAPSAQAVSDFWQAVTR